MVPIPIPLYLGSSVQQQCYYSCITAAPSLVNSVEHKNSDGLSPSLSAAAAAAPTVANVEEEALVTAKGR